MTTTNAVDVVVVGGGLAGLTAAATAKAAGASVVVLEAHGPGGRAQVTEREGFTFNRGAHALYLAAEGIDVLRRLGIRPVGSPPPLARYRALVGGELHLLPSGGTSLLRTGAVGWRAKVALGRFLATVGRIDARALAGRSVDQWIDDLGFPDDGAAIFRAILRIGTYADDLSTFDAGVAATQLQRAVAGGVLYLDGGWAQLIDALRAGLDVRPGVNVTGIHEGTVETADGPIHSGAVVVAAGLPSAVAALLPGDPGWGDLGEPMYAAALDVAVRGVPSPGYVLGVDDPVYGTVQSPPARQAPEGDSVVAVLRYGTRNATDDRAQLEGWLAHVGVDPDAVVCSRFLARLPVVGATPLARRGGFEGRPGITDTGVDGVFLAGDWVGPHGHLADAAFASGEAAGRVAAQRAASRRATMVR
jgi:phytoene dehydrogenase-like protein